MTDSDLLLDLQRPITMPARSRLFSLAPDGIGTPYQEGLLSLLVRTSCSHAINPRLLIRYVFPEADATIDRIPTAAFHQHLAGTMNGLGSYAERFVSAMEKLTGNSDLRHLTLLPWQNLFPHNGQGLLARHRQWCPVCLHEQRQRGDMTTFPLVWSFETYRICRSHSVPLEQCCPCCGKKQAFIPPYPDLGICSQCRQPLGVPRPPQDGIGFQMWIAGAIENMVAHQTTSGLAPTLNRFLDFLKEQVSVHTGGNRAAFCRALGLNEFAISGWLNKGERPSITQFLTVCYGTKTMPSEIFRRSQPPTSLPSLCSPTEKIRVRKSNPRLDSSRRATLKRVLQKHLNVGGMQSVAAIANQVGVGKTCLRYWFPDLCKSLSADSRAATQRKSEAQREEQQRLVRRVIQRIAISGDYVSYRRVAKLIGPKRSSLSEEHLRNAYRDEVNTQNRQ
ncbi:MAG: TniQ family protein [Propionivibrio sp.]